METGMEHVSTWLQAALLPSRWDVAGVDCAALSCWHVFVLTETANPYVTGKRPPDRDAAAGVLLYCSRDYEGGRRLFHAPLHRGRAMRRIYRVLRRQEWRNIDDAVMDYLETCGRLPGHKIPEGDKAKTIRPAAAPMPYALVQFLSAGNPDKIAAAWNTPYAVARCLFDAGRDIRGEIDTLENRDEERRFDEYQDRQRKAAQ